MRRIMFVSALAACLAAAGVLLAKTPDGQPPSKENPCAGLSKAAFGICNAYCEAQDCDVHPRPSCETLRKNFQKATGQSKFPCDRVACGDSAPTCNGDCPQGQVCASGAEAGGPEGGGPDGRAACVCLPPCGSALAPTCGGACPTGTVCTSGPEAGGPEVGGPETAGCACLPPCGSAVAPTCAGACPTGSICLAGPEASGPETGGCRCAIRF